MKLVKRAAFAGRLFFYARFFWDAFYFGRRWDVFLHFAEMECSVLRPYALIARVVRLLSGWNLNPQACRPELQVKRISMARTRRARRVKRQVIEFSRGGWRPSAWIRHRWF